MFLERMNVALSLGVGQNPGRCLVKYCCFHLSGLVGHCVSGYLGFKLDFSFRQRRFTYIHPSLLAEAFNLLIWQCSIRATLRGESVTWVFSWERIAGAWLWLSGCSVGVTVLLRAGRGADPFPFCGNSAFAWPGEFFPLTSASVCWYFIMWCFQCLSFVLH
jgi:hypothetical protein